MPGCAAACSGVVAALSCCHQHLLLNRQTAPEWTRVFHGKRRGGCYGHGSGTDLRPRAGSCAVVYSGTSRAAGFLPLPGGDRGVMRELVSRVSLAELAARPMARAVQ